VRIKASWRKGARVRARTLKRLGSVVVSLAFACSSGGGNKSPPPANGGSGSVSGTVTYDAVPAVYSPASGGGTLNFAGAVRKPVRFATVHVMKGTAVLATTTTDASGHYALSYTAPDGAGQLQVVALAESTNPVIRVVDNTDGGATWALSGTLDLTTTSKDLHGTHGWTGSAYDAARRSAAPFSVLDVMYTASKGFQAVRPAVVFPALVVNWSPNNTSQPGDPALGQIGTSHYSPAGNQIFVLGKAGVDTDEFDTHVIVHEWAHFFEANLSRADSPGGPHATGDNLDPRLAFGEGYGNALAAMLLPESIYADTAWRGSDIVAGGFDAETEPSPSAGSAPNPQDDPGPGAFSEMTVMRLLYDLYDSGTNETFDQVGVGLGVIYDVLTGPQKSTTALTTIASFVAGLKAHPSTNATTVGAIDALLAHYKIGPITDAWGAGDAGLAAMYVPVTIPATTSILIGGSSVAGETNKWNENEYYVFTGNGQRVTISATSAGDVALTLYEDGKDLGTQDSNATGTESVQGTTKSGSTYVVNLVASGSTSGDYQVNLSFSSP
jgi:hypothetical protein